MNKTLALLAVLGLVAAPAFANEAAKEAKAEKVVAADAKKEEGKKEEAAKEGEKAAEAAPAAGKAEGAK